MKMKILVLNALSFFWFFGVFANSATNVATDSQQQIGEQVQGLGDTLASKGPQSSIDPGNSQLTSGKSQLPSGDHAAAASVNRSRQDFKDLFAAETSGKTTREVALNPMAISFVEAYMKKNAKPLEDMKDWGRPYFEMIEKIFQQYAIPQEMKYLAVIESNLKSSTVSWAGAVGPWQFIASTARLMGLKVNSKVDERRNYEKSTHAAAKYLKSLYKDLGDWLLVVAAYNSGPGRVNSAIKKSGTDNFWKLQYNLPLESRNHVKKFIATHYIMEGNGGVTTLTKKELKDYEASGMSLANHEFEQEKVDNTRVQQISGKYSAEIIAKVLEMEPATFHAYNPNFDAMMAEGKPYDMNLPVEKMDMFNAHRYQILSESVQLMMRRISSNKVVVKH